MCCSSRSPPGLLGKEGGGGVEVETQTIAASMSDQEASRDGMCKTQTSFRGAIHVLIAVNDEGNARIACMTTFRGTRAMLFLRFVRAGRTCRARPASRDAFNQTV